MPLLCEDCGYGLIGLAAQADCPECGLPIGNSLPTQRTGPAWQNHMSVASWWATATNVLRHPATHYRTMRIEGSNLPPRVFLVTIAAIIGVGWGVFTWLGMSQGFLMSWVQGMVAVKFVLIMTYVETCGVTFFSKRRKWRVPFLLAERVTCYASVGWIIAAVIVAGLTLLAGDGRAETLAERLIGRWDPNYALLLGVMAFGAAIVSFELLVWAGVRQVRFANPPHATASPNDPLDASFSDPARR